MSVGSVNLSPTAVEAINALLTHGDGATWNDINLAMPGRGPTAVTRGINTAIRAGRMHWRPITDPGVGKHRRGPAAMRIVAAVVLAIWVFAQLVALVTAHPAPTAVSAAVLLAVIVLFPPSRRRRRRIPTRDLREVDGHGRL